MHVYDSHGLVSVIVCHFTNNSKDPHCKARIFEKQKNNNCKENEIFVLIISFSKREESFFIDWNPYNQESTDKVMGVIVHECLVDNPKRCKRIGVTV